MQEKYSLYIREYNKLISEFPSNHMPINVIPNI